MRLRPPLVPVPKSPLPPPDPIPATHDRDDAVHGTHVIHVVRGDGVRRRERVHDERERRPGQQHPIRHQAHRAHPEGAMGNVIPTSDQETDDRDRVADIQQHDARRYHGVEGRAGAEIQAPEHSDDGARHDVRVERDVERGVHAC